MAGPLRNSVAPHPGEIERVPDRKCHPHCKNRQIDNSFVHVVKSQYFAQSGVRNGPVFDRFREFSKKSVRQVARGAQTGFL
jgi:hypothetical protein